MRKGGSVVAKAETDSVGQTVSRYERKARDSLQHMNAANVTSTLTTEKNSSTGIGRILRTIAIIVVSITVIIIIRRLFK